MSEIPDVPQDIIMDIFYLLPVKSLARFRCVSRLWFLILTDSKFIKTHLNKNIKNEKLLAVYSSNSLHALTLTDQNDYVSRKLNFPPNLDQNWFEIVGSCGGLVLALNKYSKEQREMFLINPTSSKYKKLPELPLSFDQRCTYMYGFGYSDDFKVVILSCYDGDCDHEYYLSVDVYCLKENRWRTIEVSPFDYLSRVDNSGVLLHGAIHWSYLRRTNCLPVITAFDLSLEKLREVEVPNDVDVKFLSTKLVVLNGCLCMIIRYNYSPIGVWMMKEYGVQASWIKLVTIYGGFDILKLCFVGDQELLVPKLRIRRQEIFNVNEERFRSFVVDGDGVLFRNVRAFVESLVSPNANF